MVFTRSCIKRMREGGIVMQNLAEKKISILIAAGYALVILLVVALGLFAISGMNALHSISRELYQHPFRVNAAAFEVETSIAQAREKLLLIVLSDDPKKIEQWSAEIPALDKAASEQLNIVKANFLGDIRRVDEAEILLKQWQDTRDRAIELSAQGQHDKAAEIVTDEGAKLFTRLGDEVHYVIDYSQQKAGSFVEESEKKVDGEINRTWWFVASLIAAIFFTGWSVSRRVLLMVRRGEQLENELLQNALQARTAGYTRSLIEASLDPLVTISPDGKITDVNKATELVTGRDRAELIGTDFTGYFTEPDKARAGYRQVFAQGFVTDYPLALHHRDGHITDVLYNASVYRDEAGEILGVFAAARDVTERQRAEDALRNSESRFRLLVESAPMCIHEIGMDGRISSMNKAGLVMMGVEEECKVQGFLYLDAVCEADRERIGELLAKAYTGEASYFEFKANGPAGLIFKSCFVPIKNPDGNVVKLMGITEDITGRKQAELEREQYFKFFNTSTDLMCIADPNGCFKKINPAGPRMLGYAEQDLLAKPFVEFIHPDDRQATLDEMARQLQHGFSLNFENRYLCKDGSFRWLSWNANYIKDEGLTYATARDITERKLAEDAIREKEERLALATVNNGVGIWDWNLVTQEMIWDDSMYALYHIRREDFSGTEEAWRASLHPDDLARGDQEVADAISGKKPFETEFRVLWPNGEIRHIKAVAKVFRDEQGTPLRMLGINMDVSERRKAEMELRELNNDFVTLLENTGDFIYFKDKDSRIRFCSQTLANITGHSSWRDMIGKHDLEVFPKDTAQIYYEEELPIFREGKPLLNKTDPYYDEQGKPRWVNTNKLPVFGDDKKTVVGIFGISRDITELKQAEDKITELNRDLERRVVERTAQLEAANKELEAFSYSVSHDLRSPLRAIDGFSHILLDEYTDKLDEEGKRLLKLVRDGANNMGQLIDDILKFSRASRLEMNFSEIDMEGLARSVVEELQPAGSKLQVEIEAIPHTTGDRAMMHQVFVNLLSNAIKFSCSRDTATIKVGGSIEGKEAVYFVRDNGVGFDMRFADKLFGVFQRLHGVTEFEGTGIGLAIVKRIVNRHGGRVWAEGKVDEGATIYFSIPAPALVQ
jgi:PAS domain S-box-containing protein